MDLTNAFQIDKVNYMPFLPTAIIASVIILASSVPAFATDASSSTTRKEKALEKIETRKEKVTQRIETASDRLASRAAIMREKIASREAALKTKLAKFKDQKKAKRVEAIDQTLTNINKNRTDHMLKFLGNASLILTKLETRVNQAGANGRGVTAATNAISEARGIITSANEAVVAQAEKGYTITVTSESKVNTDAKTARDLLHTYLKAVLEQVKSAKKAVSNAIEVSATTLGGTK